MRRTALLAGFVVLLATVAWWFFLISPRNAEISDLQRERDIALDTEQRLRANIAQLEEIRQGEVQYLAALGKLETLIPDRPMLEDFIEQVYALSNETGVDLQTLVPALPTPIEEGSELREISISVQIEGQFFEVLGFLFGLSDLERLVRVDSVAISSSEDEIEGTVLSVSLETKLFTLADVLPVLEEITTLPGDEGGQPGDGDTDTTDSTNPEAIGGGE